MMISQSLAHHYTAMAFIGFRLDAFGERRLKGYEERKSTC